MKEVSRVKKVMIMTNGLYEGGAEKVLQTLLNNLDYSDIDVTLYSILPETLDPEIYTTQNKYKYRAVLSDYSGSSPFLKKLFPFFSKVRGKLFNILHPKLFRLLFLREKFDVELAFLEGEGTKVVSGSLNRKARKLAWVHTDMLKNNWTDFLYKSVEKEAEAYRQFDEIICVSESVKEAFIKKYGIEKNVSVRYNPVDSADIRKKANEEINIKCEKRPLIISVGRLEQPKGYPRLLECAERLKREGYEFTLWILGEGRKRHELEEYIESNQLDDTVKLLGFDANPYKYTAAADAFICSSYIEGFSTAATESIILGKPVYTLDCPGMKELFGDEKCGVIVPNTDEELYRLLKHAVTDKDTLAEYTAAAKRRAEYFSIEKRMADIQSLI